MTAAPKFPFRAPKAKIARSRKLLAELEDEVAAYIASKPISCEVTPIKLPSPDLPKHTRIGFNMQMRTNAIPESVSTVVGDALHNIRSSLDIAACDIVAANGKSTKGVHFPFCETPADLEQQIKDKHIRRAVPEAVDFIRSLKPYRGGNVALRAIHDMDVQDKHQSLITTGASFASPVVQFYDADGRLNPQVLGDPNEVAEIRIVLAQGHALAGGEIVKTLHELVDLADSIVQALGVIANR